VADALVEGFALALDLEFTVRLSASATGAVAPE
jgi:hypothetical protein